MMDKPLVSVIVPMYNTKPFLLECLESIAAQTYDNFEALLIDNCSTDGTYELAEEFVQGDKRFVLFRNEQNYGYTYSMNRGLRTAQGKYVCPMDSDDVMMSDRLQKEVKFLEENPDVFLVAGGWIKINEEGKVLGENDPKTVPTENVNEKLLELNCIHNPTSMFRNEGGWEYREKMANATDYDMFLRMIQAGKKLTNIPDKLLRYRWRSSSVTHSKAAQQFLLLRLSRQFYRERQETGKDSYDEYDFDTLFSKTIYDIDDREAVEFDIYSKARTSDIKGLRKPVFHFIRKYKTVRPRILAIALDSLIGKRVFNSVLDTLKRA